MKIVSSPRSGSSSSSGVDSLEKGTSIFVNFVKKAHEDDLTKVKKVIRRKKRWRDLGLPWSKHEDAIVRKHVELRGCDEWDKCELVVSGRRISKQVRERYYGYLEPGIIPVAEKWSLCELQHLQEAFRKWPSKWTMIAKELKSKRSDGRHRTPWACKNKVNSNLWLARAA